MHTALYRFLAAILIWLVAAPVAAQSDIVPTGFRMDRGERLVHVASGTVFPAKMAGFTRTFETALDGDGKTVVVSYRKMIGGEPVVARIAITHIVGLTAQEHFIGLKSLVGTYFRDVSFTDIVPTGEGPLGYPNPTKGNAYQGRFTAKHDGKDYELSLSTADFGYWDIRLTAAYPAASARSAQGRIRKLADAIAKSWPEEK